MKSKLINFDDDLRAALSPFLSKVVREALDGRAGDVNRLDDEEGRELFEAAILGGVFDVLDRAAEVDTPSPNLASALAAAMRDARAVYKDGEHGLGYKYASTEAILSESRAALAAHGLALIPTETEVRVGNVPDGVDAVARRTFLLVHVSGESREVRAEWPIVSKVGKLTKAPDKAHGGALTASLGYFCRDLLLLPRVEEGTGLDHGRGDEGPSVEYVPTITEEGLDLLEAVVKDERKAEAAAVKAGDTSGRDARKDAQDPSWEGDRPLFCEALRKRYGLSYDRVSAFVRFVIGQPPPSNWRNSWREAFFARIGAGEYPSLYKPSTEEG